MTLIKDIDTFIELSSTLLTAQPTTTKISTTYTHRNATHKITTSTSSKPSITNVKVYDPLTGACFKTRLTKTNQLSRVMTALGPRGVILSSKNNKKITGFASLMAGVEVDYHVENDEAPSQEPQEQQQQSQTASTAGKKKKKNKK